jgi:glycerol uptake facilitator-like aquaporin
MFAEVFAEGLGTFFFLGVILASGGNVLTIAIGLAAAVYLVSQFSGAHLNPAVSIMLFAKGDVTVVKTVLYIVAQVVGGLLALLWYKNTTGLMKMK